VNGGAYACMKIFLSYARQSATPKQVLSYRDRLQQELGFLAPGSTIFVDHACWRPLTANSNSLIQHPQHAAARQASESRPLLPCAGELRLTPLDQLASASRAIRDGKLISMDSPHR